MYRIVVLVIAFAALGAACSSDSAPVETTTTPDLDVSSASSSTAAVPATTTTTSLPTTETTTTVAAAAGSLDACVVGMWVLDPVVFFEQIMESGEQIDGEFVFVDGQYVLVIEEDGTFTSVRDDWTFAVTSDAGDLQVTVNESDEGTWSLDGDVLTTTLLPGDPPTIEILLDGVPFEFPGGVAPFEPPQVEFTGAVVTCNADTLTAQFDGNPSVWNRA